MYTLAEMWTQISCLTLMHLATRVTTAIHIHLFPTLQLEQEIDLILEKMGVFDKALQEWTNKWVPAIFAYSTNLSGKKASLYLQIRKECVGKFYTPLCNAVHVTP